MSMQTDKAQVLLLKEIAQQLCKDVPAERSTSRTKTSSAGKFTIGSMFKVIYAGACWMSVVQESAFPCLVYTAEWILVRPELCVGYSVA